MLRLVCSNKRETFLPVISNGDPEGEGAEAGHGWHRHVIHHPVDVLLKKDRHVAGQNLEWLPILDDGSLGKDPLHHIRHQIQLVDSCVVQTHWRSVGGMYISSQAQLGETLLQVLSSEAHQEDTLQNTDLPFI